ncbi:MAG: DUF885 family protein [Deltaproteobacteria bacterium]|nr:DUF885 family protein [Deltaproteobacteria bacterium]
MESRDGKKRLVQEIASDYFAYMGRYFPQQCASDEFYFFPRAEAAGHQRGLLEDLTPEKIQDHLNYVKGLLGEISLRDAVGLEYEINCRLLEQSMRTFLREYGTAEVWRHDPTLYVKVPLFAAARILQDNSGTVSRIKVDLFRLLSQIPPFLVRAAESLALPSLTSLSVAGDMVRDAIDFFRDSIPAFIIRTMENGDELAEKNMDVLAAWDRYGKELQRLPYRKSFAVGREALEEILAVNLGCLKSPEEIVENAGQGFRRTEAKLKALARKIDGAKTWTTLIQEQRRPIVSDSDLLRLFEDEVQNLRRFFQNRDIITFPPGERVFVTQTPSYLRSIRATASYSAPLIGDSRSPGIFYLTPGKEDLPLIAIHCPYLSAHETYPGHHLLDHIRLHQSDPIRRQIELPLFYEGWACYAEQLLDDLGYIHEPRRQLVGLKRQLWRCVRAELDVALQTGRMTLTQASEKIQALGFSPQRAGRQALRFALTPGYQLCYHLGNHEIATLRRALSPRLGTKRFHDMLLYGGQLPFHLLERRLRKKSGGAGSQNA